MRKRVIIKYANNVDTDLGQFEMRTKLFFYFIL